MQNFSILSDDFTDNSRLNDLHAYDDPNFSSQGNNLSPALHWSNAPPGTQSYAITVYDPDAPTGSGFWHWVLCNLPISCTRLSRGAGSPNPYKTNALPTSAVQLSNDFGSIGYGGCAPPANDLPHRYIFSVHAIKVSSLPIDSSTTNAVARFQIIQNTLAVAKITGLYGHNYGHDNAIKN